MFRGMLRWLGFCGAAVVWGQSLPSPTIESLVPSAVTAGGPAFALTVTGTRFTQNSKVVWRCCGIGSIALPTVFISQTRLDTAVPATLIETAGQVSIAVTQPGDPGTLTSNPVIFAVFPGLSIRTECPLPNAIVGTQYAQTLSTGGGTPPYVWTLAGGSLPSGISLVSSGSLSGTATAASRNPFTLRVQDFLGNSSSKDCSLSAVNASPGQPVITQMNPSTVLAGSDTLTLTIRGLNFGQGSTVVWNSGAPNAATLATTIVDGAQTTATVPANLLTSAGTFPVAIRLPVLTSFVLSNAENFTVAAPIQITSACPLRDGTLNNGYAERLTASGGFPPYIWSITDGALPAGLTLARTGELTGAPSEAGTFNVTFAATDSQNNAGNRACSLRVLGPVTAFPSSVTFNMDASGAVPAPVEISVSSAAPGTQFTVQALTDNGGPWLRIATANRTPALARLSVESGGLGPGTYRGQVSFAADNSTNRAVLVPVTLIVGNAQNPRLQATPAAIRFAAPRGSLKTSTLAILISSPSAIPQSFAVSVTNVSGGNWLSTSPSSGTVSAANPVVLRARASAAALGAGTYRALITLTPAPSGDPVQIPVTLSVSAAPESIVSSVTGVSATVAAGGPSPSPARFFVTSAGVNGIFWEATGSTLQSGDWLSVNPSSNVSRAADFASSEIRIDPAPLGADLYFGEVRINSANTDNSPRLVNVAVQALPGNAQPPPEILPAALVFNTTTTGANPASQSVLVRNLARTTVQIDFQLTGDPRLWNVGSDNRRAIGPGESRKIDVGVNPSGLTPGVYRSTIAVQVSGDPQVRAIDLVLIVPRATFGCTPSRLVPAALTLPGAFTVTSGFPSAVEARIYDDCGLPLTTGNVNLTFSNPGFPPVNLNHFGEGRWSSTWFVPQSNLANLAVTINAEDPERSLQSAYLLTGSISANPGAPVLTDNGVLSAAGFAIGAPLAPGSLFASFGSRLVDGTFLAGGFPLPTTLGTTSLQVGARDVPLIFAGEGAGFSQINAMVPFDVFPNTLQQIAVRRGARRSNYVEVAISSTQPSVFTVPQDGRGQGIIVDGANPTVIADENNPVPRGGVVVIYCEGLGIVNQPFLAGRQVPNSPLASAIAPVTVTIGGQPARTSFAGLVPGFTGLYQINAFVPDGIFPGNAVPVVINAGAQSSAPVTIAVK